MAGIVQVAGVQDAAEARMLLDAGVDLLGLPLRLPVHAPDVTEDQAADLAVGIADRLVLITYESDPCEVLALAARLGARLVQLHGDVPPAACARLKTLDPDLRLMKSLVLGAGHPDAAMARLAEYAPVVDAFLTDTYDPTTGASGATGKAHDWAVSRALARAAHDRGLPLLLAGGLRPGNVAAAIAAVEPDGVDAHTGLEDAAGRKDQALVAAFVAAARTAFAGLGQGPGYISRLLPSR